MEGRQKDLIEGPRDVILLPDEDDASAGVVYDFRRKHAKLLSEFNF